MKQLSLIIAITFLFASCSKEIPPKPIANFSVQYYDNGRVLLVNESQNATSYQWSISDGRTTTDKSPMLDFTNNWDYNVRLTAKGEGGTDTAERTVQIRNLPTTGNLVFWSTYNRDITIFVNNINVGKTTVYYSGNNGPACGSQGNVTVTLPGGVYNFTAQSNDLFPVKWSGQITVINGQCRNHMLFKN